MSSLLQNVLTARLGSVTGAEASSTSSQDAAVPNGQALDEWEAVESGPSDDELIGVASAPGTPHISRPSSPGGSSAAALHHLTLAAAENTASASSVPKKASSLRSEPFTRIKHKSKTDPLRALPGVISQRIFLSLPVQALRSCSLVCRRWRRSATLNYCWYRIVQSQSMQGDSTPSGPSSTLLDVVNSTSTGAGARWTRRESKVDWLTSYGKQKQREARDEARYGSSSGNSSGYATPSRSQRLADAGIQTAKDRNEERWQAEENSEWSKQDMRDYYKNQGSRGGKLRGKSGKGGAKTGSANDGGLWE
ncbi:hypothetical protein IE81DRAFT_10205 [Ceraceosorus guamensis]|uniref:F-box domain-containing protein n=1 Tax=Ceraceosorus guamensis TaxID=1522189 RepID=A0A316W3R4_9BASI|nr:hypothetical protein IE81DRAFT_10205 [Ceraceosorus guamensis]PWN44547.1 hypothetical protein IE81DRAFT_10205 [Ceraceosorus guamensis]